MNSKPVVFFVYANDRNDDVRYLRNLPDEARRLRLQLTEAVSRGLCELVERSNATATDVFRVFQSAEYRNRIAVFHYGGHANGHSLLFESEAGQVAAANAPGLARFMGQQTGLRLVFLNGCSTMQQVDGLLAAGVPAVIATSRAIDDKVATDFSECFYRGLTGGADIGTAFKEAEAVALTTRGGNTRGLYIGGQKVGSAMELTTDRCPWDLLFRSGSEIAGRWNLPEAADDPLFGIPALPFQHLPPSPFRNLEWFQRKHADLFFGRESEIRELFTKVTNPQIPPVILYYGQSGVGKSSLLDAGLLPRLESKYDVIYLRRKQEIAIDVEINDVLVKQAAGERPYVIVADQIEEIFTRPNANSPDEFNSLLTAIDRHHDATRGSKIILAFRKEWLADIEDKVIEREIPLTKVFLDRLERVGIIRAITGPTRSERCRDQYHLTVESGLAEIIADDLLEDRNTPIAPTLQVLLTRMWNAAGGTKSDRPTFTIDLYQGLRREGILLDDFLRMQVDKVRQEIPEAVESGLLYDFLLRHTTPLGTAASCGDDDLQRSYPHLVETMQALRQLCIDHFLLIVPQRAGPHDEPGTRLSHDTLAPVVRQSVGASELPGQRARRCLDARLREWRTLVPRPLLGAAALELITAGQEGTARWTAEETEFIEFSRKKLAADRPVPLSATLIPPELKVKRFVPGEQLDVVTADIGYQPLTFIETSPLLVVLLSFAIVLLTFGSCAQVVLGVEIARALNPPVTIEEPVFWWTKLTVFMPLMYLGLSGLNLITWFAFYRRLRIRFDLSEKKIQRLTRICRFSSPVESLTYWHERGRTLNEVITVDDCVLLRRPLVGQHARDDQVLRFYRSLCQCGSARQVEFGTPIKRTEDDFIVAADNGVWLPPPRLLSGWSLLAIYLSVAAFSFILGPVALIYGLVLLGFCAARQDKEWQPAALCAAAGALTTTKLLLYWPSSIWPMIPVVVALSIWLRQLVFDYALSPNSQRRTLVAWIVDAFSRFRPNKAG